MPSKVLYIRSLLRPVAREIAETLCALKVSRSAPRIVGKIICFERATRENAQSKQGCPSSCFGSNSFITPKASSRLTLFGTDRGFSVTASSLNSRYDELSDLLEMSAGDGTMKKLLLAAAAVSAIMIGSASAADLGARPYCKAPLLMF